MSAGVADLGDHVLGAVEAEQIAVRADAAAQLVVAEAAVEPSSPPPPMKVSAWIEPTSFSMPTSVSPSASPARPRPGDRSTVTASSALA